MYGLRFDGLGVDCCYRCKKTRDGGWFGRGKKREFFCLVCYMKDLRKHVRYARERRER